jgi:hypothetical protein
VEGDLAASIGTHHWDVARTQKVRRLACQAFREGRRMLANPKLVLETVRPSGGESLHGG